MLNFLFWNPLQYFLKSLILLYVFWLFIIERQFKMFNVIIFQTENTSLISFSAMGRAKLKTKIKLSLDIAIVLINYVGY